MRGRQVPWLHAGISALLALVLHPSPAASQRLQLLDVPFIAQSELLCGGAAAAMVMRYWGERGIDAESFQPLVDRRAGGIRTDALAANLRERNWNAAAVEGSAEAIERELQEGRPVIALIEDRPGIFHYVVIVGRNADGVIFHDPARAPFRVATTAEFDRRWNAAHRWMLVVAPQAESRAGDTSTASVTSPSAQTPCDQQIAEGIRQAQANDLEAAERTLAGAISCPGGGAFRELAGIRALQGRWPEAPDLAAAAVARGDPDGYASRLLATSRFLSGKPLEALDAWNQAGEPRIDLIRVDGLTRTRYSVVAHATGLATGATLTRNGLLRARRRMREFPAGPGTVDYVPVPSGLAEVRVTVAERPLVPHSAFDLGTLALATGITRELSTSISSLTGGGERIGVDWRFWAHRPMYSLSLVAPSPWRGVWQIEATRERQPYSALFAPTLHDSLQLDVADWATGSLRWEVGTGVDRWNSGPDLGSLMTGVRFSSGADRLNARAELHSWWSGRHRFARSDVRMLVQSSSRMRGLVLVSDGGFAAVSSDAPPDLWPAGDTGRARPLLLRAHPLLGTGERFRTERLGRTFIHDSTELQNWWAVGPVRAGVAGFVDVGRTGRRAFGDALNDVDIGAGLRAAYPGRAGALRLDVARGLRDGNTALSVVYTATLP
jgi:predicted double-glycine peptidase